MNLRQPTTSIDSFVDRSRWEGKLWSRVVEDVHGPLTNGTHCLLWDGGTTNDFGVMYVKFKSGISRAVLVHRLAYMLQVGAIPENMTLFHLCGRNHCVNVKHLELKSRSEVMLGGVRKATPNRRGWSSRKPILVEVDSDVWEKGKALARRRGMPFNMMVEMLLTEELSK